MPLFNQEIRSKQSTRTKVGRVIRAEGGFVDVVAVGGNTVFSKVKTGGLSPNVGDYVTLVFHSDGEKQAIPISSKEATSGVSSVSSVGSSGGGGGSFVAGNGLSTTIGGITNVNTVAGRTQITSNAIDVNTSLLPTPLVGEIGRVAYVSATGQLSYSSTLSLNGVQVIVSGTANRMIADLSNVTTSNRFHFQNTNAAGSVLGILPGVGATGSYLRVNSSPDASNTQMAHFGISAAAMYIGTYNITADVVGGAALTMQFVTSGANRMNLSSNGALRLSSTLAAVPTMVSDAVGNLEVDGSLAIGSLLKIAGATGGIATIQAQATVTPTLTLPSATGTLALTSDIPASVIGTVNYIPKFTGTNVIGNSHLFFSGTDIKTTTNDLYMISERTSANAFASFGAFAGSATFTSEAYFYAYSASYGTAGIYAFSNATLTYVSIAGHMLPGGTGQDVGSSGNNWRDLYLKGSINIYGATSGKASIVVSAIAGTPTLTLPTASGTLARLSDIPATYTHPNHSGDATSVGDGAITFATVNANVGTFGSTTQSVQLTVNGKGLITAISNQTIAFPLSGSGTTNYLVKWTGATALGNSALLVTTNTIENNTADTGLKTTRLASNAQLTFQAFAVNTTYVSSVIAVANDGDGGQAQFSLFSAGSAAASYIQLQGKIEFASNDTFDIGATSAPRNILADGYMWAKKTLNVGAGANRNTAYSLDVKEADLALATPTGSWVFDYTSGSNSNDGYFVTLRIWAYKIVGGRKIFSAGHLELTGQDNGLGGTGYHMDITINSVAGADGYWVRLIDDDYNIGLALTGYWWDQASSGAWTWDVGNTELDGVSFSYTMPEIPVTPSSASMDIIAGDYSFKTKGPLVLYGNTSGQISLWPTDVAGSNVIYLPASSGTLALLSDIPTGITGSGTSGTLTKWTGTSALGNSILSESGTVLSLAGSAQITLTTEQMRWRYNSSNWMALTIGSSGNPTFTYSSTSPAWDFGYTNFKFRQESTPAAPTVADSGVAGNPNGTYRYKIVFVTALGNTGWYANLSSQIVVVSKQIDLSNIPVGTTGVVTSRQIYRNATGSNIYKFVATIADNTTTTYRDNVADGSLGGTIGAFNTTGAKFSTGAAGTTDVMWLHPAGLIVSGLSIGSGTLPGGYLTWPYNQNIQSMNSTGDGFVNVLGVGASGINFGAGFSLGNQGITNLYSLTFYATARISSSAGGGNYDIEFNNSAGGTGKLKWFGSSGNYYMNLLDSASGGYAGFGTNLTPTSKLHVDGAFARNGAAKSSNFTVDVNASAYYVTTGSGADITATLVAASTCNGREYIFVKVDSGTKDIIITRAGSDTINGATTLNVGTTQWSRATIKSDGTNWVRIA